jgi:hypothetical protein
MSNAKVVTLRGEPASTDDNCEAVALMCERVAAMAREGRVTAAAIALVYADGTMSNLWEARGHGALTVAATSIMQHEMIGSSK